MYDWRNMSAEQRSAMLADRQRLRRPWHSPPHLATDCELQYHITAACYEHKHHIGKSTARMDGFADDLLAMLASQTISVHAWCVLPNHYHLLVTLPSLSAFTGELGRMHGRTSFLWNGEEATRRRKVFYRASDRRIRSEGHFWATTNYIHHNPVRHGYVAKWQEWPWSSACDFLEATGIEEATRLWTEFPILETGEGWDDH